MSDTESDVYMSDTEAEPGISGAIDRCLSKKPEYHVASKSKALRTQLNKIKSNPKDRQSSRIDSKKKLEDYFRELAADFSNLSKKFDTVCECVSDFFDRMESLEKTVETLSKKPSPPPPPPSFASVLNNAPDSVRIERLERVSSEDERRRRLLEVSITHPLIDVSTPDLSSHMKQFLSSRMQMEHREIDSQFTVKKLPRNNTVLVTFSDKKFKRFIFAAKKRLRLENVEICNNLYINENLTSYNYSILKKLKLEKTRRFLEKIPTFESVYAFEGKVYVKKSRSEQSAVCISNTREYMEFLDSLGNVAVASTSASSSTVI